MTIQRQGDVLIKAVKNLPNDIGRMKRTEIRKDLKATPLAYGEGHGHAHLLRPTEVDTEIIVYGEADQDQWIEVKNSPALLIHEKEGTYKTAEHKSQLLNPGFYFKKQQKERDPFTDTVRQVAD